MEKVQIYSLLTKVALLCLGYFTSYMQWSLLLLLTALTSFIFLKNYERSRGNAISTKTKICSTTKQELQNKLNELPSWVMFPDRERAEWLNEIIFQLWPSVNNYITKTLKGSIEANIRKKYASFRFENSDFGCTPPKIDGVKVYNRSKTKNSIIVDFDVFYDGNCDINFSISGAQIGRIKDFQLSVEVRLVLKPLLAKMPLIGGIQVFFLNTPDFNFSLEGISNIPGLSYFIRQQIETKLTKLIVFPNKFTKRFSKTVEVSELKLLEPEGVLRVHVTEAKDLERKDITGKSDPYVILSLGAQEYKTSVLKKTLNPKWDYWCEFVVLDPISQHITFNLFDEDDLNEDDFLGNGDVDISSIVRSGKTDQWIQLEHAKHGQIHLRFTWLSLSTNLDLLDAALEEVKLLKITNISTGLLSVYLDSAENLAPLKSFKKPDPYVIMSIGKIKQKSKVKKHTIDPVWEQGFTFLLMNPLDDSLKLTIMDKHNDNGVLDTFEYDVKNLLSEPNLEFSKVLFPLFKNQSNNSNVILSLQLKILINKSYQYNDDSSSDSSSDDNLSQQISPSVSSLNSSNPDPPAVSIEERFSEKTISPNLSVQAQLLLKGEFQLGRIEISFDYSEPRQKLAVTVHQVCNLPLKDPDDLPDPYVTMKLISSENSLKHKTKLVKDCCNPVFEETFENLISLNDLDKHRLIVTVKTVKKLFFNNNVIGQVAIHFKDIDFRQPHRAWFDLSPPKTP